jgi:ubiquinone/menaquinone biosynthesis C-methylase UbiE
MEKLPPGAGRSSFELIDRKILFDELHLMSGTSLLDLGCGRGEYAIAAADLTGEGQIYGIDLWAEGIADLRKKAAAKGLKNLTALVSDSSKRVPLNNRSIDVCLMATVLHDLVEVDGAGKTLDEVHRVLTPGGLLAIVEFKKVDGPPGPPLTIRLSPEDVSRIVTPHGFTERRVAEVGPYHYVITFSARGVSQRSSGG